MKFTIGFMALFVSLESTALLGCHMSTPSLIANQQTTLTAEQAKDKASAYAHLIQVYFDRGHARVRRVQSSNSDDWEVRTPHVCFYVDAKSGSVGTYLASKLPDAYISVPVSEDGAKLKAKAIRDRLGRNSWPINSCSLRSSRVGGQSFSIDFFETVEGESARPFGNHITISIHKESGFVLQVSKETEVKYYPRSVRITPEQARTMAESLIAQYEPLATSEFIRIYKLYTIGRPNLGCVVNEEDMRNKKLRYAYGVQYEKIVVFIDAETGKSFGGVRVK